MAGQVLAPVLCGIMKKALLIIFSPVLLTPLFAQTAETVSTHAGSTDQVWYSLQNGEAGRQALSNWDLAFEMAGFTSSIRVNTAKGLLVYETPNALTN